MKSNRRKVITAVSFIITGAIFFTLNSNRTDVTDAVNLPNASNMADIVNLPVTLTAEAALGISGAERTLEFPVKPRAALRGDVPNYKNALPLPGETPDKAELGKELNDLVYRCNEQYIDAIAGSELSVGIPMSFFGDADALTVVLYDMTRRKELTATRFSVNEHNIFTHGIKEDGIYSLYAVFDDNGEKTYKDLMKYVMIETESGEKLWDEGKVIPL